MTRPAITSSRRAGTAEELFRRTLFDMLSLFGRLVYLASLRDPNSGRYRHLSVAHEFGEVETDRAICQIHRESFTDWLGFTLEAQKADLDLYLSGIGVDKRTTIGTWARLAPFRDLVPIDTMEPERRLFLADLDALLRLLENQYVRGGAGGPAQGAGRCGRLFGILANFCHKIPTILS